jgi:hypothetical protein
MLPPTGALSQTLQSLTDSKIQEVEKLRGLYESQKTSILHEADQVTNHQERVARILVGIKRYYPNEYHDPEVRNIEQLLDQARYDSSIPPETLQKFESQLRARLETKSRRLGLADLYCRLLTEWMQPPTDPEKGKEVATIEDDFLLVEGKQKQKLKELCDQFESVVFEPRETNADEIRGFLDGLFATEESAKALEELRARIHLQCITFWEEEEPFNPDALAMCIRGLLTEDLLSEEKQDTLKYILENKVALREISDVLNMRYADLGNWDWRAGKDGIPVLPRQQVNGKYRIWMDEDVLQAVFTQYIFIRLCNMVKETLTDFIEDGRVWDWGRSREMTERDKLRWKYYFNLSSPASFGVDAVRKQEFLERHFLYQIPSTQTTLQERGGAYDDDDGDEGSYAAPSEVPKNIKQQLLRKIATETLIQRQVNGRAAVVQSDLQWYATALPHSTIFAVVKYLGFPEKWIRFFEKYLKTPLNLIRSFEDSQSGPRIRHRGVPMSHASEKFLGELVLFFMDVTVNRETGMLLYRMHDDLWFCGEPEQCVKTWEVLQKYARITGLDFNYSKTGSVYLADIVDEAVVSKLPQGPVKFGFLILDPKSGSWVIDHSQVEAHIQQLKKQLDHCDSIISWIRTWNSCIGRFFRSTFGEPAFCFGRPHVDAILATYAKLQNTLFDDQRQCGALRVTEFLRQRIKSHYGEFDIPDSFFFLPEELGGLGLRNPFVPIMLVRGKIENSPIDLCDKFKKEEIEDYVAAKKAFEDLHERARLRRLDYINREADSRLGQIIKTSEMNHFMSFEEYTRSRESKSTRLRSCYEELMRVPERMSLFSTQIVRDELHRTGRSRLGHLDLETKWLLNLYADELLANFGGFDLVDKKFLPVGVLNMVKGKKVKWQMVL